MELKLKHRFNFFPEISAEDSKGLKESISNGFDESLGKITLYEGKVLDGWNRYKACIETGVEPVFTTFYGNDMDAFNFSVNANLDRRHLTSSQKAAMAVSAEPLLEAIEKANEEERRVKQAETLKKTLAEQKAKKEREEKEIEEAIKREEVRIEREAELKKQQAAADEKRKKEIENEKIKIEEERKQEEINKLKRIEKEISLAELIPPNDSREEKTNRETRTKLADAFGTNSRYISDAKKLKETSPELYQEVLSGKKTITEVKKEVKKSERIELIEQQIIDIEEGALPELEGLFDVISVDPPWPYEGESKKVTSFDSVGRRVANPYPEMSIKEIKKIELPLMDDAVVLLWTTHKFLPDAFDILKEWGMDYKATLVWNKQKIGMGAWFRMQCEFCLVGVKGKPYWENTTFRDIFEEPRREHSRKPDSFFDMIEKITLGRRLEYFSREKRTGWEVFGNDINKF